MLVLAATLLAPAAAHAFPGANGKILYTDSTSGGSHRVFSMNPDGTGQAQIGTIVGDNPSWSADGRKIAFEGFFSGQAGIFVVNADGSAPTRVTTGSFPAWSPDGTRLAFADRDANGGQVFTVNLDGTGRRQLTTAPNNFGPAWSPDGTQIAFTSTRTGGGQVWLMNADGTGQRGLVGGSLPSWSPNGTEIAYTDNLHLGVISAAPGGGGRSVYQAPAGRQAVGHATWSPDGTRIAFENRDTALATQIFSVNADGTGAVQLTHGDGAYQGQFGPNWAVRPVPVLTGIRVTPINPTAAKGTDEQFTATGTYDDGTSADVTGSATWASSDQAVATVNSNGLAHALSTGRAAITATKGTVSGDTTLTVAAARLTALVVTPADPSVPSGTDQQLTATGTYTDASTADLTADVDWTSSDNDVATVGAGGLAHAVGVGTSTISAAQGAVVGTTTLTVQPATLTALAVTPTDPSIPSGTDQQFTATGTYTDGATADVTADVTWASDNTSVATVDPSGLGHARVVGTANVTATKGTVSAGTTLIVTPARLTTIAVAPADPSIPNGTDQQFTARGTYSDGSTADLTGSATWASSNPDVATVDQAGLAHAVAMGTTTISAADGAIVGSTTLTVQAAVLTALTVTPRDPTIATGASQQFEAAGRYSDGTTLDLTSSVTWSSADTAVATIDANGLAHAVAGGSSSITASRAEFSDATTLNVRVSEADLTVTLTDDPDPVAAGHLLTYTGTITNHGPATATDVTVTVAPAPSAPFVGGSTGAGAACTDAAGEVTCPVGSLAAGDSTTVSITVRPGASGTISTRLSALALEADPTPEKATATETSTVTAVADLAIAIADSPDPVPAGQPVEYTIDVRNLGPSPATGVTVVDPLPAGVALRRIMEPSTGCSVSGAGVVSCNLPMSTAGLARVRIIVVATRAGTVTNTAQVSGAQSDPVLTNNSASTTTRVLPAAGKIAFASSRSGNPEIYVMNPDGTSQTRLTVNAGADVQPAWSPDGTRIAFASVRSGGVKGGGGTSSHIYVMNADGSSVLAVTSGTGSDTEPAWSPDGGMIAFASTRTGSAEIFVVHVDGTGLRRVTVNTVSDNAPAWSPDGSRLAYASGSDIALINPDGTGVRTLTPGAGVDSTPAWSPDGSKIAFTSTAASTKSKAPPFDIFVMKPDGSGQARMASQSATRLEPAWSPDGAKIAFTGSSGGGANIAVMNTNGSGQVVLTTGNSDTGPAWQRVG
jgi:uncharacterized repeat protein (TIGR01451 family)